MRKFSLSVLLSILFVFFAMGCEPKSDNNDSLALLLLGASANSSGENLACQNKTLSWSIRTPAEANTWQAVKYGTIVLRQFQQMEQIKRWYP